MGTLFSSRRARTTDVCDDAPNEDSDEDDDGRSDDDDATAEPDARSDALRRFDLRDRHCVPYPRVLDQRTDGSCVAHAFSFAVDCVRRRDARASDVTTRRPPPTPQRVYDAARGRTDGGGTTFASVLRHMREDFDTRGCVRRVRRTVRHVKACLAAGNPVVVGIALTADQARWQEDDLRVIDSNYFLPRPRAGDRQEDVGHAAVVIGFDDDARPGDGAGGAGAFVLRNSWGEDWGLAGHFFVAYDVVVDERAVPELRAVVCG